MTPAESDRFYLDLLRAYLDSADDAIFVLCDEQKFLLCNRRMEQWLCKSEAELTRHNRRLPITRFFQDCASIEQFENAFALTCGEGTASRFECDLVPPKGQRHRLEISLNKVGVDVGHMVIGVARDITRYQQDRATLQKLASAVDQIADSVVITDRSGVIEYVNPAFERTTGYTRAEAIGSTTRLIKSGRHDRAFYERLWNTILGEESFRAVFMNRRKDGELYYEEKTITPLRSASGAITHFVSTGKDVTAHLRIQERLDHLAYHDPLTGLQNRNLFRDHLTQALAHARPHHRRTAIILLDLDNFRAINSGLGHEAGDALLRGVGERLTDRVGTEISVARVGNDEFALLLQDVGSAERVVEIAQEIVDAFAKPFMLGETEIFVFMSIGIAIAPTDADNADQLAKNADSAMHRAKSLGRNRCQFYSADMNERVRERLTLRSELVRALERNEFRLHYQPIIDLESGKTSRVEALLRWKHPERGLIGPEHFIVALEESGLIVHAGEWMLREVCRQTRAWHREHRLSVPVAVNISAQQFRAAPDFIQAIDCLGQRRGEEGGIIEFEITESIFMHEDRAILDTLSELRSRNIRLAIDDFGTGYSSLAYLTRFRVDTVKIDRSFVRDMLTNRQSATLIEAIVAMAHALGLTVVAEGVETTRERDYLRSLGCNLMQGYLFSPPVAPEKMAEFLTEK